MIDLDEVQKEIVSICETEYGKIDRNRYFVAKHDTAYNVRQTIINKMTTEDHKKSIYLDMTVYILQAGDDVFISLN